MCPFDTRPKSCWRWTVHSALLLQGFDVSQSPEQKDLQTIYQVNHAGKSSEEEKAIPERNKKEDMIHRAQVRKKRP